MSPGIKHEGSPRAITVKWAPTGTPSQQTYPLDKQKFHHVTRNFYLSCIIVVGAVEMEDRRQATAELAAAATLLRVKAPKANVAVKASIEFVVGLGVVSGKISFHSSDPTVQCDEIKVHRAENGSEMAGPRLARPAVMPSSVRPSRDRSRDE
ncbi:hypothetical protein CBL_00305 [Carabus blaptoides fortunei]